MENNTPSPLPVTDSNAKTTAIVSYLTLIGWLISYFALYKDKKSSLGGYHLRQSLVLMIIMIALWIVRIPLLFIPGGVWISLLLNLGLFVLWLLGFIAALNGQEKPIPLIGPMAQSMFSGI